jgi:predicted nucleic acid-binding protein
MAYIDTSLLAAYYCPERLSGKAQKALLAEAEAVVSPLVELELHSAVAMKVRNRELALPAANQILAMFQIHVADGFYRFVPIDAREYALARQWVGNFSAPLRTLDALHLAAAFANALTLLTADKAMALAAKHFGIKHELIT